MVARLELPGLCRAIVDSALFGLGFEYVLADNGGHLVSVFLHLSYMLDGGMEGGWLFFLDLLHHI